MLHIKQGKRESLVPGDCKLKCMSLIYVSIIEYLIKQKCLNIIFKWIFIYLFYRFVQHYTVCLQLFYELNRFHRLWGKVGLRLSHNQYVELVLWDNRKRGGLRVQDHGQQCSTSLSWCAGTSNCSDWSHCPLQAAWLPTETEPN